MSGKVTVAVGMYWQPTTGFVINVTCRLTADRPELTLSLTFNMQA